MRAQQPPPAAPTGLWAAQTGPTELILRWDSVPGAAEYRLFQRVGENEPRLVGSAARTRLNWILPIAAGAIGTPLQYLLAAVDATKQVSAIVPFNLVVPVQATLAPGTAAAPAAPTAVLADSAIRLTWEPVAGATGYVIGRAVTPYGFSPLCELCPVATSFVDARLGAGAGHTYTVEAVTPAGRSQRATSNTVPVPPTPEMQVNAASLTTTYRDIVNRLAAQLAPSSGSGTTAPPPPRPPLDVAAKALSPAETHIVWHAYVADSATAFVLERAVNYGSFAELVTLPGTARDFRDTALPQAFENGRMRVSYRARARNARGTSLGTESRSVLVENPGAGGIPGSCSFEYQRADNMWAPRSAPSTRPGVESMRIEAGKTGHFITDWKHEKLANDGTTYYGSHLRVLRNTGPRAVVVFLRSIDPVVDYARSGFKLSRESALNNAVVLAKLATQRGGATHHVSVSAGESIGTRADLVDVFCPGT